MKCPYCNNEAELTTSDIVYSHIKYFAKDKHFYICNECDARVGCHKGTTTPLGTMANRELRELRMKVHKTFDKMWKYKFNDTYMDRTKAYLWLAKKMEMTKDECHIGMFGIEECKKALKILGKGENK